MSFVRQLGALIWKNFLFTIIRHPIGFLFKFYAVPLVIFSCLVQIPVWASSPVSFRTESPAAVGSLSDGITGKLAVILPPNAGSDIQTLIDKFTEPIGKDKLLYLDSEDDLVTQCSSEQNNGCHASVTFVDSPETKAANATWSYTLRAESLESTHSGGIEKVVMPLQLAINNAITNSSAVPQTFAFGHSEGSNAAEVKEQTLNAVTNIYAMVVFVCHLLVVYQLTSWVTNERDSGVAALVDSMGGQWASVARTLSWVIVLDIVCLPLYIIFGILYWKLLFPSSSAGVLIGWQILIGLSLNSSAVFAAAFFTRARVSAIMVTIVFLALTIVSQFFTTRPDPSPEPGTVMGLSLVFPSCTWMIYMFDMAQWEYSDEPARLSSFPPRGGAGSERPDLYVVKQATLLGALGVQIFAYLALALLTEWFLHGIHFKGRSFTADGVAKTKAAVFAEDLKKTFKPGFWTRLCCCGRRKGKVAVNDVSLEAHRGQIMCLVGQNGSGKTTTLQMIGGFLGLNAGHVSFDATASQIGICPQKDCFWEELTVREHMVLWSGIKSGGESAEQMDQLMADCDLAHKSDCLAKNLSGGQKRKLQLACMFIGNSSICLIDECTSGLDPLSRQAIWDLLLRNRTNRSMIFTTHFLDEVDVLADHIVVLHEGKVKCQGSPAELNTKHGGGYKVIVERTPESLAVIVPHEPATWQDRLVYTVADSGNATQISNAFSAAGVHDIVIAGPQFEEVFLNLAEEDAEDPTKFTPLPKTATAGSQSSLISAQTSQLAPGRETGFWTQVGVLWAKRFRVLPRVWWPYFFVAAIVIAADLGMLSVLVKFDVDECSKYAPHLETALSPQFYLRDACLTRTQEYGCDHLYVAPPSANDSVFALIEGGYADFRGITEQKGAVLMQLKDDRKAFLDQIRNNIESNANGIYFGTDDDQDASIIAYYRSYGDSGTAAKMLNIWSEARAKMEIDVQYGTLPATSKDSSFGSWIFVVFISLVQAAYPAFFVVYPAIERRSKTRSLQYANGVRRTPQMVATILFDLFWIAAMSTISALVLVPVRGWIGTAWIMIAIFSLHGMCAAFISQIVGHVSNGPLKSFLAAFAANLVLLAIALGAFLGTASNADSVIDGVTFGLGLFVPLGNVVRALIIGFNSGGQGCNHGVPKDIGGMHSYGGPILYLVIQTVVLAILSVWVDGGLPYIPFLSLTKRKQPTDTAGTELHNLSPSHDEIQTEAQRTRQTDTDPLRVLDVTKRFDANVAVDDVTFGLAPGEVLALLGPNGAGKSTLVNMIQSEFAPSAGSIALCGHDARSLSARKFLGVCPQHDSLDLLTTRQHLTLYARIRGVRDVKANVDFLMDRLGLAPHAKTMAARLSGGNKRKLSLAIALMGAPPVLVLDEPTTAMDAMAKRAFWRIVEAVAPEHSILLTTHSMEEADRLATRTAIMASRMLAIGSTAQLRSRYGGGNSVSLTLRSAPESSDEEMQSVLAFARRHARGKVTLEREMLRGQIRFTLAPSDDATEGKHAQPAAIALWNVLDANKDELGIAFYSIGGATLGNAFMNVVRANGVREENSDARKRSLLRRVRDLI